VFFPFDVPAYRDGMFLRNDRVTWKEMAERNHRLVHPLMEQETITVQPDGTPLGVSADFQPTPEQIEALLGIVSGYTTSPMGWFLLWDGYGGIDDRVFRRQPRVEHSWRDYFLLRGPLGAFGELPETPSYWWPDDRAWCWVHRHGFRLGLSGWVRSLHRRCRRGRRPRRCGDQPRESRPLRLLDVLNDPDSNIPRR
jgi:hypothetical protein